MVDPREEARLIHLAAGTDIWTALAALPDEKEPSEKPRSGCLGTIIAALVVLSLLAWLL